MHIFMGMGVCASASASILWLGKNGTLPGRLMQWEQIRPSACALVFSSLFPECILRCSTLRSR